MGAVQDVRGGSRWMVRMVLAVVLVGMSLIGLALVAAGAAAEQWYFHLLVVAFAGVSVWEHTVATGSDWSWRNVRGLVLHWLGFVVAFNLLFVLLRQGMLQRNEVALVAMILLGLTVYLAGVYYDSTFLVVGPVVALAGVGVGYVQQYLFILMFLLVLVIVAVLAVWRLTQRSAAG